MSGDNNLIINISGSADKFINELDKIKSETKNLEKVLSSVAKNSAIAFAGFASAIALSTSAFIDYEKALVGVGKTTDIEGKKLDDFGKKFQKLSQDIPVSTNELLGIAQAAGQLGVSGEKDLLKFTETIAKLGVATDLSGEQAATSLTRILNVTGESIETIDTFGSVIVALGNNFAATESEIVKVTNELARSTALFGVSSAEAAGLATALKSVGVQAQLGGSVVGKAFLKINEAIDKGGDKMALISKLTGIAGGDLKQAFQTDSTAVFQSFVEGLGSLEGGTSEVFRSLDALGLKGDEVNKVLPVLAKNSKLVGEALSVAAKETKNATALNKEAEKAFATLGSEKEKLINTVVNLATDIGEELAPTIKEIIVDVRNFLQAIRNADTGLISNIASFLKWGAGITGTIATLAAFALGVIKVSAGIAALGAAFLPATITASAFWIAVTGPIGIAVAGIAALTAGIITLSNAAASGRQPETLIEINNQLDRLAQKKKLLEQPMRLGGGTPAEQAKVDEDIKKLEELRQAKIKASQDFGTGKLLARPEISGPDLGASAFGFEGTQELPFKTKAELEDSTTSEIKKSTQEQEQVLSKAALKRIEKAQALNRELKAIQAARAGEVTEEEKDVAQRRAEIQSEFAEARRFSSEQEKQLALENLNLKHAEELEEIKAFEDKKLERAAQRAEEKLQFDDAFNSLSKEQQALFREEDLALKQEQILTDKEIEKIQAEEELEDNINRRNQFLEDTKKHGETVAKVKAVLGSNEVKAASQLANNLVGLANNENAALQAIGKAAALTQIAIKTPQAAMNNYEYGSAFGGPIVGGIAAAAAIAFGAQQAGAVLGARNGGMVPQSAGRAGVDSVPAMLTPNEIVAPPESFDEVVEGTALARGFTPPDDEGSSKGFITVEIVPSGDFIGMIENRQIEAEIQNTNNR